MKPIAIKCVHLFCKQMEDGDYRIYDKNGELLMVLSSETFNLIFQIQ